MEFLRELAKPWGLGFFLTCTGFNIAVKFLLVWGVIIQLGWAYEDSFQTIVGATDFELTTGQYALVATILYLIFVLSCFIWAFYAKLYSLPALKEILCARVPNMKLRVLLAVIWYISLLIIIFFICYGQVLAAKWAYTSGLQFSLALTDYNITFGRIAVFMFWINITLDAAMWVTAFKQSSTAQKAAVGNVNTIATRVAERRRVPISGMQSGV